MLCVFRWKGDKEFDEIEEMMYDMFMPAKACTGMPVELFGMLEEELYTPPLYEGM